MTIKFFDRDGRRFIDAQNYALKARRRERAVRELS